MHAALALNAVPDIIQDRSLIAGGGRLGHGVQGINVTGEYEDTLKYGVNDDLLATLLQGSWVANVLKNGLEYKTISVENTIPAGAGGVPTFLRYRGVEAQGGSLTLKARSPASISFELFGIGSDNATVTGIAGATYTDPVDVNPISSGADIGTITMTGYSIDCMESLEINMAFENRDAQPRIMSDDFCGVTRGVFLPVLTANMYIEDNFIDFYNAARNRDDVDFAMTIPIGSVTGDKYLISFPACRFGETEVDMSGASLMQKIQILPKYDTGIGAVMQITRAVV
jgi:hypothetical protein